MKKYYRNGLIAFVSLIAFYFLVMGLFNPLKLAWLQFKEMWYWILFLALGFGIQIGLFTFIREYHKNKMATKTVAASGTMSTGSMIACCAHHLSEVLPIIGLSALAIFLDRYQIPFILLGVFSNLVGILIMLRIIKNSNIEVRNAIINKITQFNLNFLIKAVILVGISSILISISLIIRGGF